MFFTIKAPDFLSGRPKLLGKTETTENTLYLLYQIGTELRNHADNGCGRVKMAEGPFVLALAKLHDCFYSISKHARFSDNHAQKSDY